MVKMIKDIFHGIFPLMRFFHPAPAEKLPLQRRAQQHETAHYKYLSQSFKNFVSIFYTNYSENHIHFVLEIIYQKLDFYYQIF
jgi:hypothetical protein